MGPIILLVRAENLRKRSPSDVDVVWGCERSRWREPLMDQPLVQILVGVGKDLTEYTRTHNVGYWSGEGFRANGTRTRVVRTLSTALIRFVRKVKVCWLVSFGIPSGHN